MNPEQVDRWPVEICQYGLIFVSFNTKCFKIYYSKIENVHCFSFPQKMPSNVKLNLKKPLSRNGKNRPD